MLGHCNLGKHSSWVGTEIKTGTVDGVHHSGLRKPLVERGMSRQVGHNNLGDLACRDAAS